MAGRQHHLGCRLGKRRPVQSHPAHRHVRKLHRVESSRKLSPIITNARRRHDSLLVYLANCSQLRYLHYAVFSGELAWSQIHRCKMRVIDLIPHVQLKCTGCRVVILSSLPVRVVQHELKVTRCKLQNDSRYQANWRGAEPSRAESHRCSVGCLQHKL